MTMSWQLQKFATDQDTKVPDPDIGAVVAAAGRHATVNHHHRTTRADEQRAARQDKTEGVGK